MLKLRVRGSLLAFLTAILLLGAAAGVRAEKPGEVESLLQCVKVERSSAGKETFSEAREAFPGDLLEYRLAFTNRTSAAVKGLLATIPIPPGTVYVAGSATPSAVQASVDGQVFAPVPLMKEQKQPDGTIKKVPVPPEEYRFLRWKLPHLEVSGKSHMAARVKVLGPGGRTP